MNPLGLLGRLLAGVAGGLLLVAGFMASMVLLVIALVFGAGFVAYFWWKTRQLRKVMGAQRQSSAGSPGGMIIEGESVVIEQGDAGIRHQQVTIKPNDSPS